MKLDILPETLWFLNEDHFKRFLISLVKDSIKVKERKSPAFYYMKPVGARTPMRQSPDADQGNG